VPSASRWVASCPFDVFLDCTTVCTTRATSRDVRCTRRSVRLHGWHVRDLSPYVVGTFAISKPGTVLCLAVCARQRHGFLEQALELHHVSKVSCECMSELLMQVSMDLYAASMR
jgi:hypothetical protein